LGLVGMSYFDGRRIRRVSAAWVKSQGNRMKLVSIRKTGFERARTYRLRKKA